ncbi:MAG: ABC transporter ATP-binding protein/permease [Oscillospiraceae bacterium]|nr:ABC transporter ATP-binding protein/permease [Oscillospiraceae bacterium]
MKNLKRTMSNFLFLLKPQWKYGKLLFLLRLFPVVILAPIQTLLSINMPRVVVDAITEKQAPAELMTTLAIYLSAIFLISVIQNVLTYELQQLKSTELQLKMGLELQRQALKIDYKYFDDPNFFNTYAYATQQYAVSSMMALQHLEQLARVCSTFAVTFAYVILLGPWLVLIAAIPIVLKIPIDLWDNKFSHEYNTEMISHVRKMGASNVISSRDAAADLRSTRLFSFLQSRHNSFMQAYMKLLKRFYRKQSGTNVLRNIITNASNFALMAYLAIGVINGSIGGGDVGVYVSLLTASQQLSSSISLVTNVFTNTDNMIRDAEKIREFFEWESVIEPQVGGETPADTPFALELQNASFKYPNSTFSLKNLTLGIRPGAKIAIVGENGAGKSTLAKLLLRLYDVDSGEILVDGRSIREYDVPQLRSHIGVAFQTTKLYPLTLSENLRLYADADVETLLDNLKKVRLDGVLEKNDATLDTELTKEFTEEGIMLSGGETQKLGLARLLTKQFSLVLLDEPSSALDPLAEYELARLLFNRDNPATTIMIAHRLSAVRDADVIYLMSDGEITESGTHAELMQLSGKYHEMFTKQAENYVKE